MTHPSDDLEQALRTALAARAADVTPDPATYQHVVARAERTQRFRLATLGVAVAGVVVFAAVAVTSLIRGTDVELQPGPVVAQPTAPTLPVATAEATAATAPAGSLVVSDGGSVALLGATGNPIATLEGDDGQSDVTGLAVRPGSSTNDLIYAVVRAVDELRNAVVEPRAGRRGQHRRHRRRRHGRPRAGRATRHLRRHPCVLPRRPPPGLGQRRPGPRARRHLDGRLGRRRPAALDA